MSRIPAPLAATAALEEPGGRPIPEHRDALLHTAEAAFLLGLSRRTMESLRLRGGGPPYLQITPRAIRYRRRDLDKWLDARQRRNTSDRGPCDTDASS